MKKPLSTMRKMMRKGQLLAQGRRVSEGMLLPLYSVNGPKFRYQVDLVKDGRMNAKPVVMVHVFKRLKNRFNDMMARSFDYRMVKDLVKMPKMKNGDYDYAYMS